MGILYVHPYHKIIAEYITDFQDCNIAHKVVY